MFKTTTLVTTIFIFGISCFAQDDAEYQGWMKTVGPAVAAMRKAPPDASVASDSVKLTGIFEKVEYYWRARHQDDAVKFAATAVEATKDLTSGTGDRAANLQKLQGTCGGCHMAHRDGTAPNFKIK
jgi:hypothetical protein